jgi:spermidine synthase
MPSILSLAVVFITSFCLMVIELVAGRLMAPYLGVSLYTWTSVIGVILGGVSLGNYIGGRISDSFGSRKVLGVIIILSGVSSLLVRFTVPFFGELFQGTFIPLYVATFIFCLLVFFPTSLFLGCISPLVVKLDLRVIEKAGRTVGRIYAISSLGSIIGTLLTGYFFISFFGTKIIVLAVAFILLVLGILVFEMPSKILFGKSGIFLALIFLTGAVLPGNCLEESDYYCINIRQVSAGVNVYQLKLDHLVHSYIDLDNSKRLQYDYEKIYAILIDYYLATIPPAGEKEFSTFFLGGGGYTMPRYLEKNYPASKIEVAEIDPEVTSINYKNLGLPENTKIITANTDARIFLKNLPTDKKYDLVFGDAFNDYAVPYHLTTKEFGELVKSHLSEEGFYAVNIIDDYKFGRFVSSYVRTLKEIFSYVYLAPLTSNWKTNHRNTFVVLAGNKEINKEAWADIFPKNVLTEDEAEDLRFLVTDEELANFIEQKKTVLLTDDYVPVDNLLAPVFKDGY